MKVAYFVLLMTLVGCGSHDPFANSDQGWRIDGEFVDYRTLGLPGTYAFTDENGSSAEVRLGADGEFYYSFYAPQIADCHIQVEGQLETVRTLNKPGAAAPSSNSTFAFGSFQSTYTPSSTHYMVVKTDSLAKANSSEVTEEECSNYDLANYYLDEYQLFVLPFGMSQEGLLVNESLFLRE